MILRIKKHERLEFTLVDDSQKCGSFVLYHVLHKNLSSMECFL